jgi:hypothetical protein
VGAGQATGRRIRGATATKPWAPSPSACVRASREPGGGVGWGRVSRDGADARARSMRGGGVLRGRDPQVGSMRGHGEVEHRRRERRVGDPRHLPSAARGPSIRGPSRTVHH